MTKRIRLLNQRSDTYNCMESIYIQSISDVITNSSSEVYLCVNSETIKTLKEIVDSLLGPGSSELFKFRINILWEIIDYDVDYGDNLLDHILDEFEKSKEERLGLVCEKIRNYGVYEFFTEARESDSDEDFQNRVGDICSLSDLIDWTSDLYVLNPEGLFDGIDLNPVLEVIPINPSPKLIEMAKVINSIPYRFNYEVRYS